ncbi:DEAD/DEAH box helicase [Prosthecomicrobium hirschii]|uniref:DEAD/DEAH box helicase n=1 Tax=Prosthecodimorpha hirschii TaxID=665126 RepID=UPI0009F8F5BD|nr:DEAD/DEAH box helicase [Prosthecomicrobium hirschii]
MTEQPTAPQTDAPIEASESLQAETPRFSDLGLSEKVLAAVSAAGYVVPTPIQAQAIPIVLELRDIVGVAQTGTGKTASFVLPMLTRLEKGRARARMPRTLILEPTRELAAQVEENFNKYGINHKLTVALLIGGVSLDEQVKKLDRGVDVLIATPGRLLDLFERGRILMNGVEILVIDEADRMLDMGFIPDIERICKMLPPSRQTMMFSATMPPEIKRLADTFLRDPKRVETAKPATTAKTVSQFLVASGREQHDKRDVLRTLVRDSKDLKNAIVFCNRKRDVQIVYRSLEKHGFNVGALHGDMDQRARMATLDGFRAGRITLLVASDVAARGLDIPDVSHVYNYDVPVHAEDYVHRIGRTGRAGRSGVAITIVTDLDGKHLAAIEKLTNQKLEWMGEPAAAGSGRTSERHRGGDERRRSGRSSPDSDRPRHTAAASGEGGSRPPRGERPGRSERPERPERQESSRSRTRPVEPREKAAPVEAEARNRPAPRPEPRPAPRQEPRHEPRRQERRHEPEDQHAFGHGDQVPAFLLRPTRPAKAAGSSR